MQRAKGGRSLRAERGKETVVSLNVCVRTLTGRLITLIGACGPLWSANAPGFCVTP